MTKMPSFAPVCRPSSLSPIAFAEEFGGPRHFCSVLAPSDEAAVGRKLVREALQFLTMLTAPEVHSPRAAAFRMLNAHLAGRCTLGQAVRLTIHPDGALLGPLAAVHFQTYAELCQSEMCPEADFPSDLVLLERWRRRIGR